MRIDILSKTTLKLTLTADDMSNYDLCYEAFSARGSDCRKALGRLISAAEDDGAAMAARLLSEERRLFVEAFRRMDGGCMLYVSALNNNGSSHKHKKLLGEKQQVSPIIFEATSHRDMGKVCRCLLLERKMGARFTSRLFTDGNRYRLAVTPKNTCRSRVIRLFNEFGGAVCDELTAAYTEEHFMVVIEKSAVDIGAKIF